MVTWDISEQVGLNIPLRFIFKPSYSPHCINTNVGRNCSSDMKEDKFRYTKFGFINTLLSLIPIFPIFTLFPGVLFADLVGKAFNDCELGYSITLWTCFAVTAFLVFRFFRQIGTRETRTSDRQLREDFRIFSLGIYALVNTAILIIILGTDLACHGDGQSILVCIYSGPLTSIGLLLLGISVDIRVRTTAPNNVHVP